MPPIAEIVADLHDFFREQFDGDFVIDEVHSEGTVVFAAYGDGTKFAVSVQQLD